MWVTTFAFQPWHSAVEFKRYLHRFMLEFSRIETLAGVKRTIYNQYDSLVLPLKKWLEAQGVLLIADCQRMIVACRPLAAVCRFNYPTAANRMEQWHVLRLKGSTSVIQTFRIQQIAITPRSGSPAAMERSGIAVRCSALLDALFKIIAINFLDWIQ